MPMSIPHWQLDRQGGRLRSPADLFRRIMSRRLMAGAALSILRAPLPQAASARGRKKERRREETSRRLTMFLVIAPLSPDSLWSR